MKIKQNQPRSDLYGDRRLRHVRTVIRSSGNLKLIKNWTSDRKIKLSNKLENEVIPSASVSWVTSVQTAVRVGLDQFPAGAGTTITSPNSSLLTLNFYFSPGPELPS